MTQQLTDWQVEDWIRDYEYFKREINRLNKILNKVEVPNQKLTATYGDEAGMPKGSSGKSMEELSALSHDEKRLYRFIEITDYLWKCRDIIEDDKEWTTYDCMLRGMTYKEIAQYLRCSRDKVRDYKVNVIRIIGNKVTQDQFLTQLKNIAKVG
ncbi:hypothetical protein MKX72_20145 [Priestia sp. FSL R5-0597]|uniref:hypothetical protein n=1 Tax=Priestia sp. FSL R5-0597 TaxID=2921580 RepID=UPI0030F80B7C